MCQTFEFQSMDISPGAKVQVEPSSGATKRIVATKVILTMQNYNEFDKCKFRFMQQDVSGTGLFCIEAVLAWVYSYRVTIKYVIIV